jgi:DNA-binding MarR family transcriptional regulator
MNPSRPQAPGYLANLMARLFHEISAEGLTPLGVRPAQFPILVDLWFGEGPATRDSLVVSQEMPAADVDALLATMVEDSLIEHTDGPLTLTPKGRAVQAPAIAAARHANAAATEALSEDEMVTLTVLMNRVIDALLATRRT